MTLLGILAHGKSSQKLSNNSNVEQSTVLGDNQRNYSAPRIVVSGGDSYASGGVISIASTDEPAVYITSYQYSGEVDISLYHSDKNSLLNYLTYDKDNKQIKKNPDTSNLQLVTNLKQNVTIGYDHETKVVLPLEENGIWLLVFNSGSVQNYAYVIRSNFGVLAKTGNDRLVFWGQDFKNKRSINLGKVQTYNLLNKQTVLQESSFDTQGIATTKIGLDMDIAIAESNGAISLIPINMSYLGSAYKSFNAKQASTKYFIFTDRPIYQPGDTVYYKAVLRDDDDARYTIPTGSANVKVYKGWDEKQNIFDNNSTISSEGSVYGEFKLPKDASVGDYQLKVSTGKKTSTGDWYDWDNNYVSFLVEYYRKPEYFIEIETAQKEIVPPNKLSFTVKGSYFSGQPLSDQTVKYSVFASDAYNYNYYSDYSYLYSDSDYYWYSSGHNKILEGTAVLDKNGKAILEVATTDSNNSGKNRVFVISAEYDNGSGNPSFDRKNVLVYAGEFNIFRKDYGYGSQVGKELSIPLILKPISNGNVSNIPLKVKIKKENWVPYFVENQKYPSYKQEIQEYPDINLTADNQGQAVIKYTPQSEGSYDFTVIAVDSKNNTISNYFWTWVTTKDYSFNYDRYQNQLTVKASKTKYLPGEKASIIIYSQIPNRDVFLSFERSRMDRYQIVSLTGNSAIVETMIADSDLPNIYAHVSSFSDYALDGISSNIEVSTESKKIMVNITADKENYSPQETVTLNISTNDIAGNPVAAEVAVWAVDKALFELVDIKPAKIFETFWKTRYDNTPQANSLQGIVVPTSEMGGGGGGGNMRSIFKDTIYWNPSVKTDDRGRAKLSFKVSDNLTTWLIFGIAANNKTQVGQNTAEIKVSKEVIIRPILPNILRIGDEIELSGLVQNFTNTDQEFVVGMEFDSGEIKEPKQGSLMIKSNDYQKISWKVIPQKENPKSKLTFYVQTKDKPEYQDKVVLEVPVVEFGFFEQSSQSGDDDKTYSVNISPQADKQKSLITLSLAPSLYGSLLPSMKYLIYYPYGCVEQVTSTFVPAIIAKENPNLYEEYLKGEDLDVDVKAGITKLNDMQKTDGGWSWWWQLNNNPFITAYVVEYLSRARDLGFDVKDSLENAKGYLQYLPLNSSREEIIGKAYGLSFYSDENETLVEFDGVTPDILALAVMTNIKAGNKDPQSSGLSQLISLAQKQGEDIFWSAGSQANFGSINASTALAIRAMIAGGADHDLITKAVRFLLRSRNNIYWSNSFATAQAVAAITDFAKNSSENNPDYVLDITLDGENLRSEKVKNIQQKIKDINILASKIKDGGSNLIVSKNGEGQIYSTLVVNEWLTDENAQPKDNGMLVKREYLDKDGNVYKKIGVGDEITVRFTVQGLKTLDNYGILTDELPSGLIPINENFKNEQYNENPQSNYWQRASVDITRNGANFYLYEVNSGVNIFTYRARAVNAGEFLVPPVRVSLMYSPEVWGRTGAQKITVSDTKEVILTLLSKNIKITRKKTNKTAMVIAVVTVFLGFLITIFKAIKGIKRRQIKDNLPPTPNSA